MCDEATAESITDFLRARIAEDEAEARWDPDRLRAECEAKRTIVDLHWKVQFTDVSIGLRDIDVCWICHGMLDVDGDLKRVVNVQERFPCSTIRTLASVYADHPDYQQEWRL
jgi:hypothetical protein